MASDISKLILYTPDNAYKNISVYSGTIHFPTSLSSGQQLTVTSTFTLGAAPSLSKLFAYFTEVADAIYSYRGSEWYPGEVASFNIGIYVSAPSGNVGWLNCGVYPVINGNTVTVTGAVANPYSNSITLNALSVPFVFIDYELAN